jgi:protein TonB
MKLEEGAASPPNIRSKATEIAAPKVRPLLPPPLPAAAMPDLDYDATSGASDVPGPGTGSGGIGQGTGSGRGGFGPGGGGLGASPPRHISGWLRNSDYPREAKAVGMEGTVTIVVTIEPSGRVSYCDVVRSSGSGLLDETTCRLVQQRYRYQPARDAQGRPVRAREMQNHIWVMEYAGRGRG